MNRYQVITYSRDTGADEKRDYKTLKAASAATIQKLSFRPDEVGVEEAALVYDLKEKEFARSGDFGRSLRSRRRHKP